MNSNDPTIPNVSNNLNKYGLYDLQELVHHENKIKQNYNRVLKPLKQFAPFLNEDETFANFNISLKKDESNLFVKEDLSFDSENLPLNELIKEEPQTIENLTELIIDRLKVKDLDSLGKDDQDELVKIAINETRIKWKEMKRIIEDPFLNEQENIELRRRLFVNVISACEKIFNYYVEKANILKQRQIFTDPANFSRVKTLMANDLNKFLNIHSIKHHLIYDMKQSKNNRNINETNEKKPKKPKESIHFRKFYYKDMANFIDLGPLIIDDFRLKFEYRPRQYKSAREHLKEIYDNMPILETKKLEKILQTVKMKQKIRNENEQRNDHERSSEMSENFYDENENMEADDLYDDDDNEMYLISKIANTSNGMVPYRKKRRSKSMQKLSELTLAEELNLNIKEIVTDKFKTTDMITFTFFTGYSVSVGNEKFNSKKIDFKELSQCNEKQRAQKLKQDLEILTWMVKRKDAIKGDQDSLLMKLTSKPDNSSYMKELKKKMKIIDKRYKNFLNEIKLPLVKEYEHPQPATFEKNFFNNFPIRLSDIRVSSRVLRYNITLKSFPPLYNDIGQEIDSDMVKHLDRNLKIGGEVKEVYDELVKTISDDHLRFDLDDFVQKAPPKINYESGFTSSVLNQIGLTKSMNQELLNQSRKEAPWGEMNFREWNKTPLIETEKKSKVKNSKVKPLNLIRPIEIKPEKIELFRSLDPSELNDKEYKNWLNWWQDHFTTDDYLKYLTTQTSDYLGLIFHMYQDDKNKPFIETEKEADLAQAKKNAEIEREKMINDLKKRKSTFESGVWNADTILLGGLGNDPNLNKEDDPVFKLQKSFEEAQAKNRKIQFFKAVTNEDKEEEEALIRMKAMLEQKKTESPQHRMERVWSLLRMSDTDKLDMAIKYSTDEYIDLLGQAIDDWEKATELIVEREKYIYKLENFERTASDPNRFFLKGHRGSSAARLEEALNRDNLYKLIDAVQVKIEKLLILIERKYKDVIKYNGRSYLDKMKWDRIEMLHWLTEERRLKYFKHEIKAKQLKTSIIEITG